MIQRIWRELQPYLGDRPMRLFSITALAVIGGLSEAIALLLTVRVVVESASGGSILNVGRSTLTSQNSLVAAASTEVIAFVCHVLIARGVSDIGATVLRESRRIALSRYIQAPWSVQSRQREGAFQDLVASLSFRTAEVAQWVAYGLAHIVTLVMFVVASLLVDWQFTAAILGAGVVVVVALRPLARLTQIKSKAFVDSNSYFAEEAGRFASATMELKAFGVGREAETQLQETNAHVSKRLFEARFSAMFAGNIFKDIAVFLLIGSVAGLSVAGTGVLANAGVVVTLIIRGLASAQQASSAYQTLSESAPNLFAFNDRLDCLEPERPPAVELDIEVMKSLTLRDVGYTYDGSESPVLCSVDLVISAGDFIGIIGPSGGGKSTLLQLILRLRHPTTGLILINEHDYRDVSNDQWHSLVSLVPQEPSLLEATVSENISYYREIPIGKIHDAARAANVFDEIMALPMGFDTVLGPRGSGLSGGQKQRVAIARALVGNPALLVMDEPTSALDPASESAVVETIKSLKGSTTMVLVAHRLSTVEHCDTLIQVISGQLSRVGEGDRLG